MAFVNLPPNLKDMFYNLSDRISKLETGPNQAMYTAESAQTTAADAQVTADNAYTDAVAAAAAAASAQAIAGTAVQVSANTIVNASNQLTAINGGGITVYSGSSSSSGARVVLNSSGLAGYNSSNSATFAILASTGEVQVTGGILSGGSITGATINVPTAGSPAFSVNALGAVTCTNITINGGQIYLNGGVFSVSSTGVVSATSGTIGGWSLAAGRLYSGTSEMNASTGSANFTSVTTGGITSSGTINTNTGIAINSGGNITAVGSATFGQSAGLFEFLSSSGNVRVGATYSNTQSGRTMIVSTSGLYGSTSSTERKKHNIQPYLINKDALLQLEIVSFNYLEDIDEQQNPEYGFIAEDADRLGLFELTGYDKDGLPDYFAYEKLPIFLLQVIKDHEARIKTLEGN